MLNNRILHLSMLILFLIFSVSYNADALKLGRYIIKNNSRLWFEGSSTVNEFSCSTYTIEGRAILDSLPGLTKIDNWKDGSKIFVDAAFSIKTKTLDCGNSGMNEDMYEALKADRFAKINFELEDVSLLKIDNKLARTFLKVNGWLAVAGKKKPISLTVMISNIEQESTYRVQCETRINMKDFDIEPPTAFFGLVRANENLRLFLDLYISSDDYTLK